MAKYIVKESFTDKDTKRTHYKGVEFPPDGKSEQRIAELLAGVDERGALIELVADLNESEQKPEPSSAPEPAKEAVPKTYSRKKS